MLIKRLYTKLPVLSLLVLAAFVQATPDPIGEIMELSGLNHDLESIPAQITTSLKEGGNNNQEASISAIMNDSFDPETMKGIVKTQLESSLSASDIKDVLKWLDSPLGKKITALENTSSEKDVTAIQENMPKLLGNNARFDLIRQLDQSIRVSESTINTLLVMQGAMLHGAMASAPADLRWDEERIQAYLENIKPQIKAEYELLTIASMAYTYRDLPDSDIKAYINFANTPAGQHYHAAGIAAMDKALTSASEKMGEALGKIARAAEADKNQDQ